jgi:KDO2-lipid IV(A) lauroyltransferase
MDRPAKSTRNLSKFCQMPLSRHLSRRFPFQVSQSFVSFLGRLYYWRHPAERAFLAYAGENAVRDFLHQRLALRGTGELLTALGQGRGVIMVTGHYGAVEFLPAALGLAGFPAAVIVRPQTPALAASMAKRAALVNLSLIFPENGKVLPTALRALRQGRILITEMDEFEMWRGQEDDFVNFLGFSLPGDRTLDVLQKRSQAPLFTALVHRQPQRCYTVDMQPILAPPSGQGVGSQCLQRLEQAIWSAPEQWYQWKEFGKLLATLPGQERPEPRTVATQRQPQLAQLAHA